MEFLLFILITSEYLIGRAPLKVLPTFHVRELLELMRPEQHRLSPYLDQKLQQTRTFLLRLFDLKSAAVLDKCARTVVYMTDKQE